MDNEQNIPEISYEQGMNMVIEIIETYKAHLDKALLTTMSTLKSNPNMTLESFNELKKTISLPLNTHATKFESLIDLPKIKRETLDEDVVTPPINQPKKIISSEEGLVAHINTLKTKHGKPYTIRETEYKNIHAHMEKYRELYAEKYTQDSFTTYMNKEIKLRYKVGGYFYKLIYPYFMNNLAI
jgi:hypothetical protein